MGMSETQNTKDHGAPLIPGEIRTHIVGDQKFQIMHVGNGAYTQATVRQAGVPTTTVLATEHWEHVALNIYAGAIERAEAAAAPEVDYNLPMGVNPALVYGEPVGLGDVPQDRSADGVPEVAQAPLRVDKALAELQRFEEIDRAAIARGESANWWERGSNTPAEARTGRSDRVAAALSELAALRRGIAVSWLSGTAITDHIERIEALLKAEGGPAPQRARATERESWWLHSCGYVELHYDHIGTPPPSDCTKCDEVGTWRALYTLGGE